MTPKKILLIVLVIALVGSGVLLGLWGWKTRRGPTVSPPGTSTSRETPEQRALDSAMQNIARVDEDFDGLSNDEEARVGTDPKLADTDSDGLIDTYEVQKFKTNPRQADTDGDGLTDGQEVRQSLNPLIKDKR